MSSIRINSICCDLFVPGSTDVGFYIYLNASVYVTPTIDSLVVYNETTGISYTSIGTDPTLTITNEGLVSNNYRIKIILTDLSDNLPEGRYCFELIMDYVNDLGVVQNNVKFNICKVSLCSSEAQLQTDLPNTILTQKCPPEDCQDLKDKFWEAYTLYRAMKIADSCDLDIAWDNSFLKLKGLLAIIKKDACLNC
ncbi:unnamed protein product [marine sediment metagenome]|uniref:Uncharacterized protein n=1 Tax=marine sediment metagenome TaxID=412755 RepID=X0S408_9ZZZZ